MTKIISISEFEKITLKIGIIKQRSKFKINIQDNIGLIQGLGFLLETGLENYNLYKYTG